MTLEQIKKFKYWQTRTIIVSMVGYALYYFVRKNFNTAMPSIEATFGITKTQLGLFLTLNGVIYGVSRFINGFIADRVSARKFMALGLALCALVNIGFGFSDKMALLITGTAGGGEYITALTIIMGSILLLNGYFQGMGVPPVSPLMTHWVPANELATKMSIWNMSHSIGAGLIFVLGALLVHYFDNSAWRLCFLIPAVISLLGAGALYLTLRDTPSSVGLPELENQNAEEKKQEEESVKRPLTSDPAYHKAFLRHMVFGNKIIWILAATNFFVYIVRFSMLDWGMMLLPGSKGVSVAVAGIMVAVFEFVGGNLGMVVAGWATDHIFGSRAHRTCVFCMLGAILSTIAFWYIPDTASPWVLAIPFTMIAFFIYGPQALLGIAAANQATKEAAASANGILGIFGYASTLISGLGFGFVADHYGWGMTYVVILVFAAIGMLTIASIWNAKADGYEAAAQFDAERAK
ncbi:MFS transporter [uncultured Alistipes sp.]|uniref:MFS transporter n=1 Tax=uncultured Alistipes sp. TaxID=538949 RepID=UPI00261223C6|nr:MFS transporter [uncultured Alistipes sp.]